MSLTIKDIGVNAAYRLEQAEEEISRRFVVPYFDTVEFTVLVAVLLIEY